MSIVSIYKPRRIILEPSGYVVRAALAALWLLLAFSMAVGATRAPAGSIRGWLSILLPPAAMASAIMVISIVTLERTTWSLAWPWRTAIEKWRWCVLLCLAVPLVALITYLSVNEFGFAYGIPFLILVSAVPVLIVLATVRVELAVAALLMTMPVLEFLRGELEHFRGMTLSVVLVPVRVPSLPSSWQHFALMSPEILFVLVICLCYVLTRFAKGKIRSGFNPAVGVPIVLLLVASLASVAVSTDRALSLSYVIEAYCAPILLFLVVANALHRDEHVRDIGLAGTAALGLMALYHFHRLYQRTGLDPGQLSGATRFGATFFNPGTYGAMIVLFAPIVVCLMFLQGERVLVRVVAAGAIVVAILDLALGFSRGAWLAAGIQVMLLPALTRRLRRFAVPLLTVASPIILILLRPSISASLRLIRPEAFMATGTVDSPVLARLHIWQRSFELIRDYPVAGIGPGMFPAQGIIYEGWFRVTNAHNLFLNVWVESGTLALVSLILVLAAVLWQGVLAYRRLARAPEKRLLMSGLLVSLVGYIALSQTHSFLALDHRISLTLVLWMVMGLIVAQARQSSANEYPQ